MIVVVPSQVTAIQLSTVATFEAPDPWNGNAPARWVLSVYRITAESNRNLFAQYAAEKQRETTNGQNLDPDDTLGIRSSTENRYHLLPIAMVQLWQQGKVPNFALPALLAEMEPRLGRYDYHSARAGRRWIPFAGWACLALGIVCVAFGLYNNYVLHLDDSGSIAGLILTGIVFLACAAAFLLAGRKSRRKLQQQQQQMLTLLSGTAQHQTSGLPGSAGLV